MKSSCYESLLEVCKLEVYDVKLGDMKSLCLEVYVLKVSVMKIF